MKKSNNPAILFLFLMPLLNFNLMLSKNPPPLWVSFLLLLIATGLFIMKARENRKQGIPNKRMYIQMALAFISVIIISVLFWE